ncbi:MAG TPA: DoxX family protein [Gemmatimonadaceae bacterium]|nr:DoxX family protein [Gemmatimonadaceae bacterium]
MRLAAPASARQIDLGLAILRVVTGIVFAAHGAQKLFVFGLDGVAGGFGQMGIPMAGIVGPLVALVEFFGGIALILGLLTRLAAVGLSVVMLGALFLVHLPAGFYLPNGYEFVLELLAATVMLIIAGAGRWSLDARLAGRGTESASDDRALHRAA